MTKTLKLIGLLSFIGLVYCGFILIKLPLIQKLTIAFSCLLVAAYIFPFPRAVLRGRYGGKVATVALCWSLITVILPLGSKLVFSEMQWLYFSERFLMIFTATLPFEIKDLTIDKKELKTLPQQLGTRNTQFLGYLLLLGILGLIFFNPLYTALDRYALVLMVLLYGISLYFVNRIQSEFFTVFWIESVPFVGWLVYYFNFF